MLTVKISSAKQTAYLLDFTIIGKTAVQGACLRQISESRNLSGGSRSEPRLGNLGYEPTASEKTEL